MNPELHSPHSKLAWLAIPPLNGFVIRALNLTELTPVSPGEMLARAETQDLSVP